jgi:hypothetical protein
VELLLGVIALAIVACVALFIWSARWASVSLADTDASSVTIARTHHRVVEAIQRSTSERDPYRAPLGS